LYLCSVDREERWRGVEREREGEVREGRLHTEREGEKAERRTREV